MGHQKGTVRFMVSRVAFSFTLLAVLIPVIASPKTASSQEQASVRASDLVNDCNAYVHKGSDHLGNGEHCLGYVEGFMDGMGNEMLRLHDKNTHEAPCYKEVSIDTLIKVYLAFMEKNPKYLDYDEGKTLRMAVDDAYPCTK
jgi:hypothetical protein